MAPGGNGSLYTLVKWVDEDSWDVLPLKNCTQNIVETVADHVGHVLDFYWKKGEESAPCKLLAYGKQKEMEKRRGEFVSEQPGPSGAPVLGVGQRTVKRPARLVDSSDDDIEMEDVEQPKKKQRGSASETSHSILQQLSEQQNTTQEAPKCKCSKYAALKGKYADLKKERASLKEEVEDLRKYKELHSAINRLGRYVGILERGTSQETSAPETDSQGNTQREAVKGTSKVQQVDIGRGVKVDRLKLQAIVQASDSATKLARNLFSWLFKKQDVVGKSITGKQSNAHRASLPKEQLDPTKVGAIIDFSVKKFPGAAIAMVKQSLANKVKEVNKIE